MSDRESGIAGFDRTDPDPWLALTLDESLPVDAQAKHALISGNASWCRRWFLPAVRPLILTFFVLIHVFRWIMPRWPQAPRLLHRLIYWGLKAFGTPEANMLILRHFHVGTEILGFIRDNVAGVDIQAHPLRPRGLEDLLGNTFVQHDLNLYNFIIELNAGLKAQKREIVPADRVNFSAITDGAFDFKVPPKRWWRFIDVQTAIELYTPLYLLLLSRSGFERAANSLQLDETIAIYVARILGTGDHLALVKNRHPLVPLPSLQTGFRLMMHGYDAEALHGHLRSLKRAQLKLDESVEDEADNVEVQAQLPTSAAA